MSEYLDKTGLSYFWGKVKEKLKYKADNDHYKIIDIATKKFKFDTPKSQNAYMASLDLLNPDQNNFMQKFPSGYHIKCMLAVEFAYFETEEKYNNNAAMSVLRGYSILPSTISAEGQMERKTQKWSVAPNEGAMNMYGAVIFYTLLLEKD